MRRRDERNCPRRNDTVRALRHEGVAARLLFTIGQLARKRVRKGGRTNQTPECFNTGEGRDGEQRGRCESWQRRGVHPRRWCRSWWRRGERTRGEADVSERRRMKSKRRGLQTVESQPFFRSGNSGRLGVQDEDEIRVRPGLTGFRRRSRGESLQRPPFLPLLSLLFPPAQHGESERSVDTAGA